MISLTIKPSGELLYLTKAALFCWHSGHDIVLLSNHSEQEILLSVQRLYNKFLIIIIVMLYVDYLPALLSGPM